MGYEINWYVHAGDPVLKHPIFQKYSNQDIGKISDKELVADLANCRADRDSSSLVAYLSWLIRCRQLLRVVRG